MKNVKPVASQDRPKLIAVSVAIVVALGFVVRNIAVTGVLANSKEPEQVAMSAPAANTAPPPVPASGSLPEPSAATDTPAKPAGFGDVGQIPLNDPFHPVAAIKNSAAPAAPAPAAVQPAPPAAGQRPLAAAPPPAAIAAARRPAPALPALEADASAARRSAPAEPVSTPAARSADVALAGARPADGHSNELPEALAAPAALTGTVGSGAAAVATFRVGEETVFARPQEMVAGWRVVRIDVGQVLLSHHNHRRLVCVGNSLLGSPRLADRAAAAPAG
jgi:hypothetical protein